jgi:hypothetical protein
MLNLSTPDHFYINIGYALEQPMLTLLKGTLYNIEQRLRNRLGDNYYQPIWTNQTIYPSDSSR